VTEDLADIPPVERASGFLACISAAVWLWTIPAHCSPAFAMAVTRRTMRRTSGPIGVPNIVHNDNAWVQHDRADNRPENADRNGHIVRHR
jgi:hypothetical protein